MKNSYNPAIEIASLHTSHISTESKELTLKEAFKSSMLVGTALSIQSLRHGDDISLNLALKHFNAFTAENSMKPEALYLAESEFFWRDADKLVDLAEQTGATVVGHTLVWHSQTPNWFFRGEGEQPLTREVALARMKSHIHTVVGRYKGRIKQWDVVNEALSDEPDELLRPTPWLKAIGEDYIAEAFHAAHAADPDAILIYNDYSNDHGDKRDKTVKLLKSLLEQGVPVHAVGMQCHWQLPSASLEETENSIRQYAALGLQVMVTELDVSVLKFKTHNPEFLDKSAIGPEDNPYADGLPLDVEQKQAALYKQAFEMFLRHKDVVKRVTFWGISDGESWLNDFPIRGRADHPLLFDRESNPKPAFFAVRDAGIVQRGMAPDNYGDLDLPQQICIADSK